METQSAFMAAAAAGVLLAAVLRQHRSRAAAPFALLIAAFAALAVGHGLGALTPVGVALVAGGFTAAGSLAPLAALQFARAQRPPRTLRALARLLPLVLAGSLWWGLPGLLTACAVWAGAGTAYAALVLARQAAAGSAAGRETPEHTRLRYLAFTHAAIPLAAALDAAACSFGQPRVATLAAALLCFYMGYLHLEQIRVKDLRQLLGDAVGLTFMAAGLTAAFSMLRLWGGPRLDVFVFNAFAASFVMLIFLRPLRVQLQAALDRRFVASKLALERAFAPLRARLAHILTLDELQKEVMEACESTGRLTASAIFLREHPQAGFQHASSFGLPPRLRLQRVQDPLWVRALESERVLQREELERLAAASARGSQDPRAGTARALLAALDDLGAQLVLPLRGDALVGFWTLADVSQREAFSSREIELLEEVARSMARSAENSNTFARLRARDRLAMIGELSAGLAHEIRNPLATIRGAVALLETSDPAQAAEIRRVMVEEISRLDRLVDTFLNYARPSLDQAPIQDLGAFVHSCVHGTGWGWQSDGPVELQLQIEPELPPIRANADHLERILHNLLGNALEALEGHSHGRIRVCVRRTGAPSPGPGAVQIEIEDNGPGMDAATLERVFVPFFTTKARGTGLGLPLCERLVRAQDGELQLRSAPGEGTQVRIWLPAAAAQEKHAT